MQVEHITSPAPHDSQLVSALWAVDPFEHNLLPDAEAIVVIRHFLGGEFSQLHPVYVCSKEHADMQNVEVRVREYLEPLKLGPIAGVEVAQGKTSCLILLHVVNFQIISMSAAQGGGLVTPLPNFIIEDQKAWADREIDRWLSEAHKSDVKIHFQTLVEESLASAAAAIERIAEGEKVGLIGLVSHVGPVARLALGSVTQDLMSSQKFNLWVCGPKLSSND